MTSAGDHQGRAYAIVTGGGTAGHVQPALAIAEALVDRGHERGAIHYVGAERGVEARIVPPTGFPLTLLPGRGIQRRLTTANLTAVAGLVLAFARAVRLVRRLRPRVVVAVGGYASVAVALAAALWRVPVVVAEQNAVPGAANRLIARFARVAAVSFPGTPLPRAVVTGNPVRRAVVERARRGVADARQHLGLAPDRRLVLAFGGSLGALRINQALLDALPRWASRPDLSVYHVVGERDWDAVQDRVPSEPGELEYRAVRYEDDMPTVMAAADLALCRAGSTTCFELAAAALPAILVPSPHVTADQQSRNARLLAEAGSAVVVPDAELEGERLASEVDRLLADPAALADMAQAARAWAPEDAAAAVADLVEAYARG